MNLTSVISKRTFKKLFTPLLLGISIAAFAALGDGGKKGHKETEFNSTTIFSARNFSLRSGYNYKSNHLFAEPSDKKFIMLNTVVTYQKGNVTYVMPLKKKVLLDKIKFNPAPLKF